MSKLQLKLNPRFTIIGEKTPTTDAPIAIAKQLRGFQDAYGMINPITVEQVEASHEQDLKYSNFDFERAWETLGDMIATASRRMPDGWAIDWHPADGDALILAPESFWNSNSDRALNGGDVGGES